MLFYSKRGRLEGQVNLELPPTDDRVVEVRAGVGGRVGVRWRRQGTKGEGKERQTSTCKQLTSHPSCPSERCSAS